MDCKLLLRPSLTFFTHRKQEIHVEQHPMCKPTKRKNNSKASAKGTPAVTNNSEDNIIRGTKLSEASMPQRRGKRVKQAALPQEIVYRKKISKASSSLRKKHEDDSKSGGIDAILPSLGIVIVLAIALVAKSGWRGRSTVAGIDLGTTNSVICVQQQSKGAEGKLLVLIYFLHLFIYV